MDRHFIINATTTGERYALTARIRQAISESGGWVTDHHAFSNRSISMTIEISALRLSQLLTALRDCDIGFTNESERWIESWLSGVPAQHADEETSVRGSIQITFSHDEPDLRHEVPAVPG